MRVILLYNKIGREGSLYFSGFYYLSPKFRRNVNKDGKLLIRNLLFKIESSIFLMFLLFHIHFLREILVKLLDDF